MLDIEKNFKMLLLEVQEQLQRTQDIVTNPDAKDIEKLESRDDYLDNYKSVIENDAFAIIHGKPGITKAQVVVLRAMNVATSNLERIGDHAVNIARQMRFFSDFRNITNLPFQEFFDVLQQALGLVTEAFAQRDMNKALSICRAELTLDTLYKDVFDSLLLQLRSGRQAGDLVTAIFIFRYLERMGDALLNIGEAAIFAITGSKFKIRQFNALADVMDTSDKSDPYNGVEFSSIWGSPLRLPHRPCP